MHLQYNARVDYSNVPYNAIMCQAAQGASEILYIFADKKTLLIAWQRRRLYSPTAAVSTHQ